MKTFKKEKKPWLRSMILMRMQPYILYSISRSTLIWTRRSSTTIIWFPKSSFLKVAILPQKSSRVTTCSLFVRIMVTINHSSNHQQRRFCHKNILIDFASQNVSISTGLIMQRVDVSLAIAYTDDPTKQLTVNITIVWHLPNQCALHATRQSSSRKRKKLQ